ncbi:hypothetical protein SLEP1_g5921 [Rubroshorea leprosula]|uniref:Pentatricopeptide repeat-containing protein-mitochondrial domain-containing protein n=1 Tax=Rubroshorea leprosula TaxID=152421 RepID=A0AAV5I450_9ROSI|nr:hypothetical protein SLEP1_g5921 [Rubroshorea leprosula]
MYLLRKLPIKHPNSLSIPKTLAARFYTNQTLDRSSFPDEPTSAYYDELTNNAARSGDLETILVLFNKRRRDGCFPTTNTFKFLTNTESSRSSLITLVQTLIRVDKGLARNTAFESLIARLCKLGWIDDALQVLDAMSIGDCRFTAFSFYPILQALTKKGKVEEAWRVMERMREVGVPPDLTAYNYFLTSHCYDGNLRAASEVMKRIEEEGLGTDARTYDALVLGACRAGKVEGALMVLGKMVDDGFHVMYCTHVHVIKALLKLGYYDQAVRFVLIFAGKDEKLDTESFGVLAHKLITCGRLDEAKRVLEEMVKRGLKMGAKLSKFYESECKEVKCSQIP